MKITNKDAGRSKPRLISRRVGSLVVAVAVTATAMTASSFAASLGSDAAPEQYGPKDFSEAYKTTASISDSVSIIMENLKNQYPSATTVATTTSTSTTTTTTATTTATAVTTTVTTEAETMEVEVPAEVEEVEVEVEETYEYDESLSEEDYSDYTEEIVVEEDVQSVETAETIAETSTASTGGNYSPYIDDYSFMLLANTVGHEAGSYWISIYEKAEVVEVIMNRVYDSRFPSTIADVLTAPYQFTGASTWSKWYADQGCFNQYVTEDCQSAVNYYFEHPDEFSHGYLYFWGDGSHNHFS